MGQAVDRFAGIYKDSLVVLNVIANGLAVLTFSYVLASSVLHNQICSFPSCSGDLDTDF